MDVFGSVKSNKNDLLASLVVFLVALPLCLGIALASKAPLLAGIVSGVVGGVLVGFLSRSPLSVSGPAAGLVVIVAGAIEKLGDFESFLVALILAGIIQLLLGFIKVGLIGLYFPAAVIRGMLAAIGIILIRSQLPHLLGLNKETFLDETFGKGVDLSLTSGLKSLFENINIGSLVIGLFSLGLLAIWSTKSVKNHKVFGQIPGGIVAVLSGILFHIVLKTFLFNFSIEPQFLVQLPIFDNFSDFQNGFVWPNWAVLSSYHVYVVAGSLAIVASLETLLSIEAVDKLDPKRRKTPQNEELKAQGLGNIVSGFLGGLPITAVIVRSSANLEAGAQSKKSAIFHGLWLLLAVALLPNIMNLIPLSSLAAILILVGLKLTQPALYKFHYLLGKQQFIPFIVTILSILFTDLLIGILVGLSVGIYYILAANYRVPYHMHIDNLEDGSKHVRIRLSEHVSFLNKASLQQLLEGILPSSYVTIDGSLSTDIDYDALEVIYAFVERCHEKNIRIELKEIPELKMNLKSTH